MKASFAPGVLKGNYPMGLETCGADQDLRSDPTLRHASFMVTLPTRTSHVYASLTCRNNKPLAVFYATATDLSELQRDEPLFGSTSRYAASLLFHCLLGIDPVRERIVRPTMRVIIGDGQKPVLRQNSP